MNEWEKFGFSAGACYSQWGMALHFILGIWGAPIFIYSNVFHASIYELLKCFGTIIYGKGILILFLLMTMIVILKICKIVYGNNNPSSIIEIVLVFLSSYFIFAPIYIQGLCDIIEIFFLLLGLYFYISKSKKIFYIIVFMISVSLKQVSILFIIPFLVLIEKNIAKIFFSLGVILAPTLLNKILWGGPINVSVNVSNIEGLLLNKLPVLGGNISIFIVLYAAICCFCYFYYTDNVGEINKICIMIGVTVFSSINLFSNQIYRCIYVIPFLALAFPAIPIQKQNAALILETIIECFYAIYQISNYDWCFEINNCQYMMPQKIWGDIFNGNNLIYLRECLTIAHTLYLDVIAGAMVLAISLYLIFILKQRSTKYFTVPYLNALSTKEIIGIRILLNGFICLSPIFLYVVNALTRL